MATDTALFNLSPRTCLRLNCGCSFGDQPLASIGRWKLEASGWTADPPSDMKEPNFAEFSILHRAHERQEYFAWSRVKSVANIAALVGPAALLFQV